MMTFESRKSRRLIVRLDRGEELIESLEALARRDGISAGWVRGIGSLAWVELDRHDQARKKAEPPQRFETACELLALEGNLAAAGDAPRALLYATIARRTDNGVDVIGGRVRAAGVFACELVVEHFADLELSRAPDEATGLARFGGASPAAQPSPSRGAPRDAWTREPEDAEEPAAAPGAVSWADVAAVSAAPPVSAPPAYEPRSTPSRRAEPGRPSRRRAAEDALDSELLPQKGDFIDHRQFGLCKIDREDDDGGLIIRLPSGVRKTIKLDYMEVGQPRMEGTRRVFPIRPRRR